MYRSKIRSLIVPVVLTAPLYFFPSECKDKRERGEEVLNVSQRLKAGLKVQDLKGISKTNDGGVQVYVPKTNFGKFGRDAFSVARVATADIQCNYKDIISLWLDQSQRQKWDSSCTEVIPIRGSDNQPSELSHWVEKRAFGNPFIPSRDYVIAVCQPCEGTHAVRKNSVLNFII